MSRIDKLIADLCPEGVEFRTLKSLARRSKGTSITAARMKALSRPSGEIRVFAGGKTFADVDASAIPSGDVITTPSIIVRSRGNIDFTYYDKPFSHKSEIWSYSTSQPDVEQRFIYYYLTTLTSHLQEVARATSVKLPQLAVKDTDLLRIPVPPLEVQREIVRVLDKFTQLEAELEAELEARRRQYEHYKIRLLTFDPKADWCTLGEIADYVNGKAQERFTSPQGDIPLVTARFVSRNGEANRFIHHDDILTPALAGDTALVLSDLPNGRALARTFFVDKDNRYAINQRVARIRTKDQSRVDPRFIYRYLDRNPSLLMHDNGVDQTHLSKAQVTQLRFPLPPLEEQRRIVSVLDKFDSLVNDLSIGLPAELAARRKQYEHYRDRLLTFEEKR